jgi:hypothetical protein
MPFLKNFFRIISIKKMILTNWHNFGALTLLSCFNVEKWINVKICTSLFCMLSIKTTGTCYARDGRGIKMLLVSLNIYIGLNIISSEIFQLTKWVWLIDNFVTLTLLSSLNKEKLFNVKIWSSLFCMLSMTTTGTWYAGDGRGIKMLLVL